MKPSCEVEGCSTSVVAKGKCQKHYGEYYRKFKKDNPTAQLRKPLEERFFDKVKKTDYCWEWTGKVGKKGYGVFWVEGKERRAHRVSYSFVYDTVPPMLDHICLNKKCVNPEHLRDSTNKQNSEHLTGAYRSSKSGVRGVVSAKGKWQARVVHNYKYYHVGTFDTVEEANKAVIAKRLELFTYNELDKTS